MRPLRTRIRENVVVDLKSGCWQWQASFNTHGYGQLGIGSRLDGSRRLATAHRVAYQEFVGPVPDGLELDHLCRNRACCNPEHLEPVPHHVNIRRAVSGSDNACKNGHTGMFYSEKDKRYYCRECRAAASTRYRERNHELTNARSRESMRKRRADRITN